MKIWCNKNRDVIHRFMIYLNYTSNASRTWLYNKFSSKRYIVLREIVSFQLWDTRIELSKRTFVYS